MTIGEKIKKAIDRSGWDPNKVAAAINMSTANLYRIFKRDSVETKYLQRLSELLNVPIGYFLDDPTVSYNLEDMKPLGSTLSVLQDRGAYAANKQTEHELEKAQMRIEHLTHRLQDKEEIIQLLRHKLAMYEPNKGSTAEV